MLQAAPKARPTFCNHGSLNEGFHLLRRQARGTPEDACAGAYSSCGVCKPQRGRGPVSHVPEPEDLGCTRGFRHAILSRQTMGAMLACCSAHAVPRWVPASADILLAPCPWLWPDTRCRAPAMSSALISIDNSHHCNLWRTCLTPQAFCDSTDAFRDEAASLVRSGVPEGKGSVIHGYILRALPTL